MQLRGRGACLPGEGRTTAWLHHLHLPFTRTTTTLETSDPRFGGQGFPHQPALTPAARPTVQGSLTPELVPTPQVRGSGQTDPTPGAPRSQLLCDWPANGSLPSLLGFVNLLEWLIGPSETPVHVHHFIIKGDDRGLRRAGRYQEGSRGALSAREPAGRLHGGCTPASSRRHGRLSTSAFSPVRSPEPRRSQLRVAGS